MGLPHRGHPQRDLLEQRLEARAESAGDRAIDQAMIEGEADAHHRANHDLAIAHNWLLGDLADAEKRRLRRVEDRRFEVAAVTAEVAERERGALDLVAGEAP